MLNYQRVDCHLNGALWVGEGGAQSEKSQDEQVMETCSDLSNKQGFPKSKGTKLWARCSWLEWEWLQIEKSILWQSRQLLSGWWFQTFFIFHNI